jgi:hypothetical protein
MTRVIVVSKNSGPEGLVVVVLLRRVGEIDGVRGRCDDVRV